MLAALEISKAPAIAVEKIRGPVLRAAERAGKRYAGQQVEGPIIEEAEAGSTEADPTETTNPTAGG